MRNCEIGGHRDLEREVYPLQARQGRVLVPRIFSDSFEQGHNNNPNYTIISHLLGTAEHGLLLFKRPNTVLYGTFRSSCIQHQKVHFATKIGSHPLLLENLESFTIYSRTPYFQKATSCGIIYIRTINILMYRNKLSR